MSTPQFLKSEDEDQWEYYSVKSDTLEGTADADSSTSEEEMAAHVRSPPRDYKITVPRMERNRLTPPSHARGRQLSRPSTSRGIHELPLMESDFDAYDNTSKDMFCRGTPISEIMRRWRIKFTGAPGEDSEAFLERLTEQRRHCNIADKHLLRCLTVCLEGIAGHWYKKRAAKWKTWDDFVTAFRKFFGDTEYSDTLLQNIKDRSQGENEPVRDYIVSMEGMFDRLDPPWPEKKMIKRTYWGAKALVRQAIDIRTIDSFEQLQEAMIGGGGVVTWQTSLRHSQPSVGRPSHP